MHYKTRLLVMRDASHPFARRVSLLPKIAFSIVPACQFIFLYCGVIVLCLCA
ncbi:Protein of unknown function [Pyronema omphalodes CBS 100304]|uniref:Uncharacterized protein n=1 Tax=Pyronema omphalodes (strain CBS 100304) TaxID=1076935 RepID=U4KVW8_PYROM|nr:Protein of unknown function [Pyronema omphalodes CBS 100304]